MEFLGDGTTEYKVIYHPLINTVDKKNREVRWFIEFQLKNNK